jgi:hypothetical protein
VLATESELNLVDADTSDGSEGRPGAEPATRAMTVGGIGEGIFDGETDLARIGTDHSTLRDLPRVRTVVRRQHLTHVAKCLSAFQTDL